MINGIQTMEDLEKLQDGKLFEFGGIGNSALCQINLAKKLYRLEKKYGNDSTDTSKPPS